MAEIAEDAGIAWANFTLFTFVLIFALITQTLFNALHNGYTFMLFAICNLLATILYILLLKDISNLSKQEVKNLYKPKKHRIMSDISESTEENQK